MPSPSFKKLVLDTLEELKATDICVLDVQKLTAITDYMIICSGRSSRHVKSTADHLIQKTKEYHHPPLGVEGLSGQGDWVLVDLNDIVVHIMTPDTRSFYALEKLWDTASHNEPNHAN